MDLGTSRFQYDYRPHCRALSTAPKPVSYGESEFRAKEDRLSRNQTFDFTS